MPSRVWITLPRTWPASSANREIDMVRRRSTMPSVMSVHTATAVLTMLEVAVMISRPGAR